MDIQNNSIIDTVIDYANVKFGVELPTNMASEQLKNLSFQQTLELVNVIKNEDDDGFSDLIDLSAVNEGYKIMPPMDPKYAERDGLEGPFTTLSGKVVYYDPKEGSYYDPDTDMYLSYEEFQKYDTDYSGMKQEAISPTAATISAQRPGAVDAKNDARDEINAMQDAKRDNTVVQRTVAGAAKQPTGSANRVGADPDDQEREMNAQAADQNSLQAQQNAKEIERLKQLAFGRRK